MATTKKAIAEAEQAAEIKEAIAAPTTEPETPAVTLDELESMDMNMFDTEETESAPRPAWRITDDGCADWACRKIAEEKTELDRITALGESQIEKIQQRIDAAQRRYENGTRFLTGKLAEYFETVPHKTTTKRQITVNIKFTPNKTRQMVGTQITVTTKLAATEAIDTQMVMGVNIRTGQIEIAEYDGQIRGQMDLSDFTDADQDQEPEETQAAAPTPGQNPTGKPLDLKNRGKQAPAAAAELVPGRDYDPDTGEVYETAGQPTDDRQTTGGRNNMKVVKIAPAKEA